MAFITMHENGDMTIDDSHFDTKSIAEAFATLIEKKGFDFGPLACGMPPSPDFGYFELANRFWRASLCIYACGVTNCFWERGVGYAEPWLFNARHAVELYVKGFLLSTIWLEKMQTDPHISVEIAEILNLRHELGGPHKIGDLYSNYEQRIKNVVSTWNYTDIPEKPELNYLVLSSTATDMLKELDQSDETSFRFRYPSLKTGNVDSLQELHWHHYPSKLFSKTGLPKEAGYFFNHVAVINNLHELITALQEIEGYFRAIQQQQDLNNDYWHEFLAEYGDQNIEF